MPPATALVQAPGGRIRGARETPGGHCPQRERGRAGGEEGGGGVLPGVGIWVSGGARAAFFAPGGVIQAREAGLATRRLR